MSSTYSTSLRLQLMGTGDQSGTWGSTTNTNLGTLLEQAITGVVAVTMTSSNTYTLTSYNGVSDDARNLVLIVSGSPTTASTIVAPAVNKFYIVVNNTPYSLSMTCSGGAVSFAIPSTATAQCYCDAYNLSGNGIGFYAASNITTYGTMAGQNATAVAITGGTINSTSIGATTPSTGSFTTLNTTSATATTLNATSATATSLTSSSASVTTLTSPSASINTLTSSSASITTLTGSSATITTVSDAYGNVRSAPINSQTSSYVLVATDNGKAISITTGGVTVPNSVMSSGNMVIIYNNSSSSQTITQGSGLTLQWAGQVSSATGSRTLGLYGLCTILFTSSSTAIITGSGLT